MGNRTDRDVTLARAEGVTAVQADAPVLALLRGSGTRTLAALWLLLPALWLYGRSNGLNMNAALAAVTAVGVSLILLGLNALSTLTIATLLLVTLQERNRSKLRTVLLLLAVDAGSRGARRIPRCLIRGIILLLASWFVSSQIRLAWRTALTGVAVLLILILGTAAAIDQGQRVSNGKCGMALALRVMLGPRPRHGTLAA